MIDHMGRQLPSLKFATIQGLPGYADTAASSTTDPSRRPVFLTATTLAATTQGERAYTIKPEPPPKLKPRPVPISGAGKLLASKRGRPSKHEAGEVPRWPQPPKRKNSSAANTLGSAKINAMRQKNSRSRSNSETTEMAAAPASSSALAGTINLKIVFSGEDVARIVLFPVESDGGEAAVEVAPATPAAATKEQPVRAEIDAAAEAKRAAETEEAKAEVELLKARKTLASNLDFLDGHLKAFQARVEHGEKIEAARQRLSAPSAAPAPSAVPPPSPPASAMTTTQKSPRSGKMVSIVPAK